MTAFWLATFVQLGAAQNGSPTHCPDEVARQLRVWQVVAPAVPQPPLVSGATLRHWPTQSLGVWVAEQIWADRAVAIRVGPEETSRVEWSPTCTPNVTTRERTRVSAPAFSDADLTALFAASPKGVIYLWTPNMPLSVDGYRQLLEASAPRGLTVQALLHPDADRAFAAASLADGGLPPSALRVADSVELQFREVSLHAPSIAVYAGGRLIGSVLRGYRTAAEYATFLDRVLAPGR